MNDEYTARKDALQMVLERMPEITISNASLFFDTTVGLADRLARYLLTGLVPVATDDKAPAQPDIFLGTVLPGSLGMIRNET